MEARLLRIDQEFSDSFYFWFVLGKSLHLMCVCVCVSGLRANENVLCSPWCCSSCNREDSNRIDCTRVSVRYWTDVKKEWKKKGRRWRRRKRRSVSNRCRSLGGGECRQSRIPDFKWASRSGLSCSLRSLKTINKGNQCLIRLMFLFWIWYLKLLRHNTYFSTVRQGENRKLRSLNILVNRRTIL